MKPKKTEIKKFVSVRQMREIDAITSSKYGIASIVLMENAGKAVADESEKVLRKLKNKNAAVVCGSGNNAGDGFVAARYLNNKGFNVSVFLTKPEVFFKGDCKINFEILKKLGINVLSDLRSIDKFGIIVDAVLGTGINGIVKKSTAEAINKINYAKAYKISVDIPSGMNGDTGEIMGCAVKAERTVTFAFKKNAFKNKASKKYTGKIITADIGIPKQRT